MVNSQSMAQNLSISDSDWCSFDTGYRTLRDQFGRKHSLFVSATRDGSIWIRFGRDFATNDWSEIGGRGTRVQSSILDEDQILLLQSLDYLGYCVVTDFRLGLHLESSWNPSFVSVFDPALKETKILSFKNLRDCQVSTSLSLEPDKQGLRCDDGGQQLTSCGLRNLPPRGTTSPTLFLRYINIDLEGPDHWYCAGKENQNWYTLTGSYYYAYVRVAACNKPAESRSLGSEVKLRPRRDDVASTVILPDPTQTSLSDAVITGWQIYATTVSIEHSVFLQVWRPTPHSISSSFPSPSSSSYSPSSLSSSYFSSSFPSSSYSSSSSYSFSSSSEVFRLVAQTFLQPSSLRFQELSLATDQVISVQRGDILGLFFPHFNPIGWTSVPCSSVRQRHRFLTTNGPANLSIGQKFRFSVAPPGVDACRYYSLRALFGNVTSRSKVVDDWACPGALPCSDSTSYKGTSVNFGDPAPRSISLTIAHNESTIVRNGKSWRHLFHRDDVAQDEPCPCAYILLIVIVFLAFLLTTVGFTSYQSALND